MHRFTFAVLAAATGLAACGGNDAAKTDTSKVAQSGAPAATAMYDPTTRTATIHAKDFAYTAADSIPAGWTTFHLVNDGANLHHVQIARLDSGKTAADVAALFAKPGPFPGWLVLVGGPNAPNPGAESNGTLNLAAGNYVMFCLVDTPDHVPHVAKGMIRPLTVTASTSAGAEPAADLTVALTDYAFATTGTLSAGHHTIKVTNNGPQAHEIEVLRFLPGKTMKDLVAWGADLKGPAPFDGIGGISGLAVGGTGTFSTDLTPGNYALICFYPAPDGKAHVEHGMVKEFKIN